MFQYLKKVILILIIFTLTLSSCTTMKLKDFPNASREIFNQSLSRNGLLVVAQPIFNKKECLDYFGLNLIEKNILPIHLSIKNENHDQSFFIFTDSIRISDESQLKEKSDIGKERQQEGEGIFWTGGVLISPLLMLAAGKALSDASIINENYEAKKLHANTIEPGEVDGGFIYFSYNKLKSIESPILCLDVVNSINQQSFPYCLKISIEE